MKLLLSILIICFVTLTLNSCGQAQSKGTKNQELKALAKFVSNEGGDKIYISKFIIIKDFTDVTSPGDTVSVGYYFYKDNNQKFDTVLLTLDRYDGQKKIKNYFICPGYDAKFGIQKAKVDFIDFDYWEGCETGKGKCNPLTFTRTKGEKNWFLIMPCGGTETSVTVTSLNKTFSEQQHLFHDKCPPFLKLTDLKDGKYFANMMACGLGGQVEFNLTTKN